MARGRSVAFPGLQSKFENSLNQILSTGERRTGREMLTELAKAKERFKLTDTEVDELNRNLSNYISRAKKAGVLSTAGGPWQGYSLVLGDIVRPVNGAAEPARPVQAEAFLHFAATLALSEQLEARVVSLATAIDRTQWGNPDMLMIRGAGIDALELEPENEQIVQSLRKVDATPPLVLSSIELKCGIGVGRREWFQALSETSANSSWANESWLVFFNEGEISDLDGEILSLAKRLEICVAELIVRDDELRIHDHVKGVARATLRLHDVQGRPNLLREAGSLVRRATTEEGTEFFFEQETDSARAVVLLEQCFENLHKQKSFNDLNTGFKSIVANTTYPALARLLELMKIWVRAQELGNDSVFETATDALPAGRVQQLKIRRGLLLAAPPTAQLAVGLEISTRTN